MRSGPQEPTVIKVDVPLDVICDVACSDEHAPTQEEEAGHGPQPPQGGAGLHGAIAAGPPARGGERAGLLYKPPLRGRRASLPRRRRACRALATWHDGARGVLSCTLGLRVVYFCRFGYMWPNSPATPRECSLGPTQ